MTPAKKAPARKARRKYWDGIPAWGPNPHNDYLEVFSGVDGRFYWHRRDGRNDLIVADGAQGYADEAYALLAAVAYCPGCPIRN